MASPSPGLTAAELASSPLPRLPPELLEHIVALLHPSAVSGDPSAQLTLVRLSGVSRLLRHWAQQALYTTLILPRHVREFRKWYARLRQCAPPFPFAGYARALFCALDDISRLTATSAGWDAELLRLLHYCGPTLTHLSLWRNESTALLRDPGQVRASHRLGKLQPLWKWGETGTIEVDTGTGPSASQGGGRAPDGSDAPGSQKQQQERQEAEPADQIDMPNWLRRELLHDDAHTVTLRHRAHIFPTSASTSAHPSSSSNGSSAVSRGTGCRPTHISLLLALPLYEHEDPPLFAMMTLWSRVQELDVYVPTPSHTGKVLRLLASLHRSPLRRLRISTSHASLVLMTPPFPRSKRRGQSRISTSLSASSSTFGTAAGTDPSTIPPLSSSSLSDTRGKASTPINLAHTLARFLAIDALHAALLNELTGRPFMQVGSLEQLLTETAVQHHHHLLVQQRSRRGNTANTDQTDLPDAPPSPTIPVTAAGPDVTSSSSFHDDATEPIRIAITQGNQHHWGKLKDRLWDFTQRAEGRSDGAWEVLS